MTEPAKNTNPISGQDFYRSRPFPAFLWAVILLVPVVAEMSVDCCRCATTINVDARPNASEVFLNQGVITVNYTIPLVFVDGGTDGSGPSGSGNTLRITVSAGDTELAVEPVENPRISQTPGQFTINYGTFSFYNPTSQYLRISGSGAYVLAEKELFISIYPTFREWGVPNGETTIVGGNTYSTGSQGTLGGGPPPVAPTAPTNIHAVIISGLSDPTKIIASPNVTLTGGIVALGKDTSPPQNPSSWSPGLRIVPDYGLLTGEKIPPVTPNILDVRIVRQEVTADFPSPNQQPSN
jgi:hypothetical protein